MNKSFCILILCVIILHNCIIYSFNWRLENRIGLGPAWHKFFSYELYAPTIKQFELDIPNAQIFDTLFDVMPFADGKFRTYFGNHINIQAMAGGGGFRNNIAQVADQLAVGPPFGYFNPSYNEAWINATVVMIDIQVGLEYPFCFCNMILNPVTGYQWNQENMALCVLGPDKKYTFHTIWQGGYIGLEGTIQCTDSLSVRSVYKFLIGNFSTDLTSVFGESVLVNFNVNTPHSQWRAPFYGNIFGCEGRYCINDCWKLGSELLYLHYKNSKKGCVVLGPEAEGFVTSASILQALWQQIAWTFFVELTF